MVTPHDWRIWYPKHKKWLNRGEYADGSGFPDYAWYTAEGTTATPPYDKLELRLQLPFFYNGATWKGRTIESFKRYMVADGLHGNGCRSLGKGVPTTGYLQTGRR